MSGIQDINSNQFLSSNYWIFIVTDKPEFKLSANEIYQTRMNDGFWGLNERTSYRKQLKKGDEVIFCYGTKKFLGTAKLATDCFELNEEQKVKFSHGHDYYKHNYGVMLSDIEIWAKSKDVSQDIYQFPKYFQGAIKKIRDFRL